MVRVDADEAQRQLALLDQLVGHASHEMKGPLHVLLLACHLLETRLDRGEPIERANVEQIRRQVKRLNRQLEELLDFGRLRQQRVELAGEELDLAGVVREVLAEFGKERAADLKPQLPERALVRADLLRTGEIVQQLMDNALRFTPMGTPIEIGVARGKSQTTLTVRDRGPGIPEGDRATLFESRAPEKMARPGRIGLGLSLYIARSVAQLMGGDLEFSPVNPSGAEFRLKLPNS